MQLFFSNLGDQLVVEIHKGDTHNHFNIQIILALCRPLVI